MREEGNVRAFFDDCHAKGAEMADLLLLNERGAGVEDGAVEVLGRGEGELECVDAENLLAAQQQRGYVSINTHFPSAS